MVKNGYTLVNIVCEIKFNSITYKWLEISLVFNRHSLYHAPRNMKDIPLVSLANILHRGGLYNNALIVTNMALEISPKFVVTHFTMANIYVSKVRRTTLLKVS